MAGVKHDSGKLPYHLISPHILNALATILEFGAKKYAPRNWEDGMDWSRVFGALQRHMWAWWGGEKLDPETGKSHLWHAACCLMFLIHYEMVGIGKDDRPSVTNDNNKEVKFPDDRHTMAEREITPDRAACGISDESIWTLLQTGAYPTFPCK